jgi:hypothetical protein
MKNLLITLLIAVGALTAAPAAAQTAPARAPPVAVAPHPRALEIAELMLPMDQVVDAAARVARRGYFMAFESNENLAALGRSYPGMAEALWPLFEAEVRKGTAEEHPAYMNLVASFYSSRFTPSELEALRDFYSGPTGLKMIGSMYRTARFDAVVDNIVRSPDAPISQSSLDEAKRVEAGRLVESFTAEDRARLMALARSVPKEKMDRANAELGPVILAWMNRPTPELDARFEKVLGSAMDRYIAEHPAKD